MIEIKDLEIKELDYWIVSVCTNDIYLFISRLKRS